MPGKDKIIKEDSYIICEDTGRIFLQCVGCHAKNGQGVFWGATQGYGPWEIKCPCGHMIQVLGNQRE